MKQPWMKFYPADWRADPALRMCSLSARGLWLEMLAIMHEAEPRGLLLINGRPVAEAALAGLVGCPARDVRAALLELEHARVFSRKRNGVIFSRRMEKDENQSRKNRDNGRKGGNPSLSKQTEKDKSLKPPLKAKKPEVRSQKPECSSNLPVSTSTDRARLDGLEIRLRAAAGLEMEPHPGLADLSPILGLLDAGYDLETDILAVIRARKPTKFAVRSWKYFLAAIRESRAERVSIGEHVAPAERVIDPERQKRGWCEMMRRFRDNPGSWPPETPRPGTIGCPVPASIQAEFGITVSPASTTL